jgi:succinoglycan biosynthesis transport protein ExoP
MRGGEAHIDIRAVLGLLRRQVRVIAATVVVVMLATVAFLFAITPIYTATALIMVNPDERNALSASTQISNSGATSARIDSEVEFAASQRVLTDVIAKLDLVYDPEFGLAPAFHERILRWVGLAPDEVLGEDEKVALVLENFRENVSVRRRGLTYIIVVSCDSRDRERAALLANTIAQSYIELQLKTKVESTLAARDAIRSQINQTEKAVITAEQKLDGFIRDNLARIVAATGQDELAALNDEIIRLESGGRNGPGEADPAASQLTGGISDSARPGALLRPGDDVLGSGSSVAELVRNAYEDGGALSGRSPRDGRTGYPASPKGNGKQLGEARRELNAAVLDTRLPPDILAEIYGLQQIARNTRIQYETLLSREQVLDTEAEVQIADSRIISPALVSMQPSFPQVPVFLGIALFFGLSGGVGLGFLFENFVGGFTSEEHVEAVTQHPLMSIVPRLPMKEGQSSLSDLLVDKPLSAYSESVRRLRATVDRTVLALPGNQGEGARKQGIVVMVSSALPGEGKTTTALALARAYALSGKRTLIIDCDFRKPSVHQQLAITPVVGIGELLTSHSNISDLAGAVAADPKTGLSAIIGSRRVRKPSDQLFTEQGFRRLINVARNQFDRIIIDSAPILPVVDGSYLIQHADVCVFVARFAATPQRAVMQALRLLEAAKPANCTIGCVLNQKEREASSYHSNYYVE